MVNKTSVLIRSFLKKSRAQVIALVLLFIFSSLLLNTFVYIQTDYSLNYERNCENLDTEDLTFVYFNSLNMDLKDEIDKTISSIDCIEEYEIADAIVGPGSIEFNGGELDNVFSLISYEKALNKNIGKYEILNDIDGEGVILSYLFNVSAGYKVNDSISFTINENEYKYKIVGFYNNPTTGTINCPDITILITDKLFNELSENSNKSYRITMNVDESDTYENSFNSISLILSKDIPYIRILDGNNINTIQSNRYSNASAPMSQFRTTLIEILM